MTRKLKKSLDKWGEKKFEFDLWEIPILRAGKDCFHQMIFTIWDKARRGNIKCIEILAQLYV